MAMPGATAMSASAKDLARPRAGCAAASWTADHVELIAGQGQSAAPVIGEGDFARISDDLDIWDAWPVQQPAGTPAQLSDGSTLWMALGSPRFDDPDERHAHARIHLLHEKGGDWRPLGPVMPDGFSPGSREWSGSAIVEPGSNRVTLYFTATGRRGEIEPTFEQRIFSATATLHDGDPQPPLRDWRDLREIVVRDPGHYMASDSGPAAVGAIKAFRDPAYFEDPVDGCAYLLFAGSAAGSSSAFNGVVGAALADAQAPTGWRTIPPLISADGLNNELERPHVIAREGRYYLFWSTQSHVFDPAGPVGPTGLYGMVGDSMEGPWRPLNGSGLVFANPPDAPRQAYSWLVLPDLAVISFVDDWGAGRAPGSRRRFGASFAPVLGLALDGDSARLAG
jgi:levansucrase